MSLRKKSTIKGLFAIISLLLSFSAVNALSMELNSEEDVRRGSDIEFEVIFRFDQTEEILRDYGFLTIKYLDLSLVGPDNFNEECRIYNDASFDRCDLDLDIDIKNKNLKTLYTIEWDTDSDLKKGEYSVSASSYVLSRNPENLGFNYCEVLEGIMGEGIELSNFDYDETIDFYEDGKIDLSDVVIFSQNRYNETWCESHGASCGHLYGRLTMYYAFSEEFALEILDFNEDGNIDLTDIVLLVENMEDEGWCEDYFNIYAGIGNEYSTGEENFEVKSSKRKSSSNEDTFYLPQQTTGTYLLENNQETDESPAPNRSKDTYEDRLAAIWYAVGILTSLFIILYFAKKISE